MVKKKLAIIIIISSSTTLQNKSLQVIFIIVSVLQRQDGGWKPNTATQPVNVTQESMVIKCCVNRKPTHDFPIGLPPTPKRDSKLPPPSTFLWHSSGSGDL